MGSIYFRGNVAWIKYYRNGEAHYESSNSHRESDAKKLLKLREGQIVEGRFPSLNIEKILFDELAEDLVKDYELNGKKSVARAARSVVQLMATFKGRRAVEITSPKIEDYVLARRADGAGNATINRELSALKRMLTLGARKTPAKVIHQPFIAKLKEPPPRNGYLDHDDYRRLKTALPEHLKPVLAMAYHTGMRRGEILNPTWDCVDFVDGKITLRAGTTKNGDTRTIFMTEELFAILRDQRFARDEKCPECPYVFFREGKPIQCFRGAWAAATKKAGMEGRLFHDLRRSAIRNMVRAGISESVVMKIGSVEFQVGWMCGLKPEKSSLPAIKKMTVRIVRKRPYPRALRLAAWNRPLMASKKPLVWRDRAQATIPSR